MDRVDLPKLLKDALDKLHLTPAMVLDAMTPREIVSLFFKEKGAGTAFDREGAVAEFNRHRAAQGLKPVVPGWMWPDVPKAGG